MTAVPVKTVVASTVLALLLFLTQFTSAHPSGNGLALTGAESVVRLAGPYASYRFLVEDRQGTAVRDVSDAVRFRIADPTVVRITDGTVRGLRNGETSVTIRKDDRELTVPVQVTGLVADPAPRFVTDVLPVLTRSGCNMGGCHGAASGKGGFRLSLQGYDPDADHESITRAAGARRVNPAQPENSLLLRKPTMAVPHRGGRALEAGSPEYRLLADWIRAGMPGPKAGEPEVLGLDAVPAVRTLPVGGRQRFRVLARFSDGTRRDVTSETLFSGSDSTVVSVTPDGTATVTGKGEGAVLVRYRDLVTTSTIVSPFAPPLRTVPKGNTPLDRILLRKLAGLGLQPSSRCSDADFLRRAYLDLIGTLPEADTVRAFLADRDPQKREKLVDALFERPEYTDYWTLRWGDILRSSRNALGDKGLIAFNRWLRDSVATNKPWNRLTRELVLASGSTFDNGPANYYRASAGPEALTETTAQVFLGVRIQCARCHNHPYERWKQDQYYRLAAFFARVRTKDGANPDEKVIHTAGTGDVTHPRTKQAVTPAALDATPLPATFAGDRRRALADWLTGPDNPFFARILVNRIWKHFMGQGLAEPVDDLRVTNPPTNPELLDYLAKDFVRNGYDVRRLIRTIMVSDAYQRSAIETPTNAADTKYYSRFFVKRVPAEPLLDALTVATGVPEKFGGYPAGLRATELPDTTAQSYFLDLFGRPARNIVCQCERIDAPNLSQVLHFVNGKNINARLASENGRVARLIGAKTPDNLLIEELYLAALSRYPTEEERLDALVNLAAAKDRRKEAEDILWALLNSKEFLFNH
ncbi:MAG: DUF1553 domain-containing protein [Capsulimonadales bacterium]|nr:DUF1553 domain-containing protein [Capsulimonadales bacterium]